MMDLQQLEQDFVGCTSAREDARGKLFRAAEMVIDLTRKLETHKMQLVKNGHIDGANETVRKAQLADLSLAHADELREAEEAERLARYEFDAAQAAYDLCRYRLRIAEITITEIDAERK